MVCTSEREEGAKCCLLFVSPKTPVSDNTVWEIVAAGGAKGQPQAGEPEYHILSISSGLYVVTSSKSVLLWYTHDEVTRLFLAPYGTIVTGDRKTPTDPSVRYKIRAAGNGAY
jgi:hypothetical protein